ncbi:putative bifunctional diguanylate cyclase/phosphodiesterase [Velocimicrobium porci]|uniref:EAL domain-containing protein n=1 Tax=Velocimicrobium porci TaxID=2606634 RepID=A0A6L5XW89_9FIRM|nr:EAL domain-containing protein [Velocimicrobium porci]MSS63096.1 EAL domain-containing protein [Velocimicrobium porci]
MNWIIITTSILCVFLFLFLLYYITKYRKNRKAEEQIKEKYTEINESYNQLKEEYEKIENENTIIIEKYEELKKSEEKYKKTAYTDHITGLPNRTAFTEQLDSVIKTLRKDETIALMYIDLDNFKRINELLGHSYGDELLIDATDRIKQITDENDYLSCFGGDEFIILTQNIEDVGVYEEKIKKIQSIFSYPFVLAAREFFVTLSIGVCLVPKDGKTTQTVLKNLDSALYAAKSNGKNTYFYYDESINKDLMDKIEIQAQLRSAITNQEFDIYYQPQIDLENEKIIGFEALLRWNHPTKGVILPAEFIQVAEETGLIVTIGEWVLKRACEQLKEWENQGFPSVILAVNLSRRQFRDKHLVSMVSNIIEETGIAPNCLELEIKEEIAIEDINYTMQCILDLRQKGVLFSLDDFGTGYSSLNYLKHLPLDSLKLDKSFIDSITEDRDSRAIISTLISLARALGINVIAEGVESGSQEDFLKDAKCNQAQGFLYSEPVPAKAAGRLLEIVREGGKLDGEIWF